MLGCFGKSYISFTRIFDLFTWGVIWRCIVVANATGNVFWVVASVVAADAAGTQGLTRSKNTQRRC